MENKLTVSKKLLWSLAATLLSLLIYGYSYELSPNVQQVAPFIQRLMDSALFPADRYVNTVQFFPSLFPRIMAFLGHAVPLYQLHLLLFIVFKTFMFYMTVELALLLTGSAYAAIAAAALTAICPLTSFITFFGEDPLMKNAFFPTSATAPFLLLSLTLLLKNRIVLAFAVAAATYYINGLPVNYLLVVMACLTFISKNRKDFFKGWAIFVLLWLPWLAWYMYCGAHNPYGGASPEFIEILRGWYSGHYFMSSWPPDRMARAFVYLALAGFFFWRAMAEKIPHADFLKALCAAMALCITGAFVFSEILPSRIIITLQLYRADSLFNAVAVILAGWYLTVLFRRDGGWLKAALLLNVLSTHLYLSQAALVFFILVCGELAGSRSTDAEKRFAGLEKIFTGTGVAVGLYAAGSGTVTQLHSSIFGILCLLILVRKYIPALANIRRQTAMAGIITALPLVPLMIATLLIHGLTNQDRDWNAVQRWAAKNTPVNSRFLTPPGETGFRVFSGRSPVVEWLDGAAMHWTPGFEKQWYAKIQALRSLLAGRNPHVSPLVQQEYMQPVTAESILRTAILTRASYIVTLTEIGGFPMPPVYTNATFCVYETMAANELP